MEVATPERVSLNLPIAGPGSRTAAYLIDAALILLFWLAAYFTLTLVVSDVVTLVESLSTLVQILFALAIFATQWIYWTACEVFLDGQTPGKRIARIRVVREDGSPVGFFESAVRNLLRVVDFLPGLYAAGMISLLVTRRHRRLGDLAAGTLLIRAEQIDLDRYVAPSADPLAQPALSARDTELVLAFLERAPTLEPAARERLASGLITRVAPQLAAEERAAICSGWEQTERFLRAQVRS